MAEDLLKITTNLYGYLSYLLSNVSLSLT